jgi:outer membrane protein assembly factor BamB
VRRRLRLGRFGLYAVLLLLGLGGGIAAGQAISVPARPLTLVGPSQWTKYAFDGANNPVYEAPRVRGWAVTWASQVPEPLQQASVVRGVVYATGDGMAPGDGHLYAFDAATGSLLWKTQLDNMSMTTPVVAGGMVFVGTGNQFFRPSQFRRTLRLKTVGIVRGRGPNAVYGISATSGRVIWRFETPGEDMPTFVYRQGVLYVANGNGEVYALAARTGRMLWSVPIGSYVSMSSPTMAKGILFVSGAHPYRLYAVDTAARRLLWSRPVPGVFAGSDDSSLAVAHGRLFLEGTGGTRRHAWTKVYAFSTAGRLLWSRTIASGPLPHDIEVGSPVVVAGTVYAGSPLNGDEVALSAQTGRILWRFSAAGPIATSVAVDHGVVYVGDGTGILYALNSRSGRLIAAQQFGGRLAADYPVIVGATLYEPDENGVLIAMPLAAWSRTAATGGPWLPRPPAGPEGSAVARGLVLFTQTRFGRTQLSCSSCHWGAGTLPGEAHGQVIPPLVGAAASFPSWRGGQIVTLDDQINRCLAGMGASSLKTGDPRLADLNAYLHWLASAFPPRFLTPSETQHKKAAGC